MALSKARFIPRRRRTGLDREAMACLFDSLLANGRKGSFREKRTMPFCVEVLRGLVFLSII
jgi:hypothetical protein